MKKHPKLYKETMTTDEAIEFIPTVNDKMGATKWLKRNNITFYKTHKKAGLWDRSEVMKCLEK